MNKSKIITKVMRKLSKDVSFSIDNLVNAVKDILETYERSKVDYAKYWLNDFKETLKKHHLTLSDLDNKKLDLEKQKHLVEVVVEALKNLEKGDFETQWTDYWIGQYEAALDQQDIDIHELKQKKLKYFNRYDDGLRQ